MRTFYLLALSLFTVILSGCENGDSNLMAPPAGINVIHEIAITPRTNLVPIGFYQQLHVNGLYSDDTVIDLTDVENLTWSSSNTGVATVNSSGLVTAVSAGSTEITVVWSDYNNRKLQDIVSFTVTKAVPTQLQVTPKSYQVAKGMTHTYRVEAIFSDDSVMDISDYASLEWMSSETTIADVAQAPVIKGVGVGDSTIEVLIQHNGVLFSDNATLTVTDAYLKSIDIAPDQVSLPLGLTKQLTATALFSDDSTYNVTSLVDWKSDNSNVVAVSEDGVITAKALTGTVPVEITASATVDTHFYEVSIEVSVTDAVVSDFVIDPKSAFVPHGLEYPFTATAIFSDKTTLDVTKSAVVSWSTSDKNIATIDNNTGIATAENAGQVTITAKGMAGDIEFTDTATLTVTSAIVTGLQILPVDTSIPLGLSQAFKAIVYFSDNTSVDATTDSRLSWSSSDTNIATISNSGSDKGTVYSAGVGSTTITAKATISETEQIQASTTFYVTSAVVTDLQVSPPVSTLSKGLHKAFTATALMSDSTSITVTDDSALSWSSSDTSIAPITSSLSSGNGVALGKAVGTVTITARGYAAGQEFIGTATLEVDSAKVMSLSVSPETATVPSGVEQQFIATATLSDNSEIDVTSEVHWSSNNSSIATIGSHTGLAKGYDIGSVTITAYGEVGGESFSANSTFNVTQAVLNSVVVTPELFELPVGLTHQYSAVAYFSDNEEIDITADSEVSWHSSNSSVAIIDSQGIVTALTSGSTNISVSYKDEVSNTVVLTVTPAALTSITVFPSGVSLEIGEKYSVTVTAVGLYTDGSEQDITNQAYWIGQDISIATVTSGKIIGASLGATITKAIWDDIESSEVDITVIPSLTAIIVSPTSVELERNDSPQQLTAYGSYNDGRTGIDITGQVNWLSADGSVVNVSGGSITNGTGPGGETTVSANLTGITSNQVDVFACNTLAGPCIDVFDFKGDGRLFVNSPSVMYADWINADASGFTYQEDPSVQGKMYSFDYDNADYLCQFFADHKLENRENWRMPTKEELEELSYSVGHDIVTARGWAGYADYLTSTEYSPGTNTYWVANLWYGVLSMGAQLDRYSNYVSCISEP